MKLRRIIYKHAWSEDWDALVDRLGAMELDGQISLCEYYVEVFGTIADYEEIDTFTLDIDPESVRINNPGLDKAAFVIAPDDATVTWDIASGDFVDEDGPGNVRELQKADEAYRQARLRAMKRKDFRFPLEVVLGFGGCALLLTAIVLKRRGRSRE